MILEVFPSGPLETNGYLIGCPKTKKAAVVDAPHGCFHAIVQKAKEHDLTIEKILLTHSHWDHIADVALFKKELNAAVFVHQEDSGNLQDPGSDRLPMMIPIKGVKPDGYLTQGQKVQVGDLLMEVLHTPGHSPGCICLYCVEEHMLLSGDTLFCGSMGRVDLPTSEPERMWQSLKRLAKLPPDTKVFPGHGPTTMIKKENWMARAQELFGE